MWLSKIEFIISDFKIHPHPAWCVSTLLPTPFCFLCADPVSCSHWVDGRQRWWCGWCQQNYVSRWSWCCRASACLCKAGILSPLHWSHHSLTLGNDYMLSVRTSMGVIYGFLSFIRSITWKSDRTIFVYMNVFYLKKNKAYLKVNLKKVFFCILYTWIIH